ncbi:MAG: peptide chain release factor 1 [Anaerolineae bacterium]|nr:MAG: peptide chain release factor 1 [Anaerolineae bacterium]
MLDRLTLVEARYDELTALMADPAVAADHIRVTQYAQERAEVEPLVEAFRRYKAVGEELHETQLMLGEDLDPDMEEMVRQELAALEAEQVRLEQELQAMLLPKDPRDKRNVIMEIRAGAGGDEAGLFAADLFRMYSRYAENQGWKTEMLSAHETGIGGFKEVVFEVRGKGAFSRLKFESGVHRVQRVPVTESSGRIHTSTATVAVLPEVDEVDVQINPSDIEVEVYISSGPGGQHMQKNATAVRLIHKPTGVVVSCESERSQTQNRRRAMSVLRARLYEAEQQKRFEEIDAARRSQVGSGERSEKIRTYNFPQNRVTDHRIGLTSYQLGSVLDGDLDEFVEALIAHVEAEQLEHEGVA